MHNWWFWGTWAVVLHYTLVMIALVCMLRGRRSPGATIAWLLSFFMIPYFGVIAYFLFGGTKLRHHQNLPNSLRARASQRTSPAATAKLHPEGASLRSLVENYGLPPVTVGNRLHLCLDGAEMYEHMIELIDSAEESLWVLTFIFSSDPVATTIRDRIVRRAEAGVKVRVLIDGVGSFKTSSSFFDPIRKAGGEVAVFHPLFALPFARALNLRNHRKMIVADGRRAYAGGLNINAEGLGPKVVPGMWRDLGGVVEGPIVAELSRVFLSDWFSVTGQPPDAPPMPNPSVEGPAKSVLQLLPSGPDVKDEVFYQFVLSALYMAQNHIWVATPYFVPNDSVQEALLIAVRRGVEVKLLVPEHSNHPLSDVAAAAFLRELHEAGGQILGYPDGMMHAKAFVVDDVVGAFGSANLDMRSLFLNYELMLVAYSAADIADIASWFDNLAAKCKNTLPPHSFWRDIAEGTVRMVSPLF